MNTTMPVLLILILVGCNGSAVRDMTFDSLESETGQKVVLFCGGDNCAETTDMLTGMSEFEGFEFVRINCESDGNKEKCAGAGFGASPALFTNTIEAGIEPYTGELTSAGLTELLEFRTNPITDSNVVYFQDKEHLDGLVAKGAVLAKFHQQWCGHCKTMKKKQQHFEKASQVFAKDGPIHLVDIDCGQHTDFCSTQNIQGYPTVTLFTQGGGSESYSQARTFPAITAYLKAHMASKTEL